MTSELDKWANVHEEWIAILNFLEFIKENDMFICVLIDDGYGHYPMTEHDIQRKFYEAHAIDAMKLENERRALLETARQENSKND